MPCEGGLPPAGPPDGGGHGVPRPRGIPRPATLLLGLPGSWRKQGLVSLLFSMQLQQGFSGHLYLIDTPNTFYCECKESSLWPSTIWPYPPSFLHVHSAHPALSPELHCRSPVTLVAAGPAPTRLLRIPLGHQRPGMAGNWCLIPLADLAECVLSRPDVLSDVVCPRGAHCDV